MLRAYRVAMSSTRSTSERIEQAVRRLGTDANVWVATGSAMGVPHLVPLSLAWDGARALVVTRSDTPTVKNVMSSGQARLALDSTEDVVIFDADAAVTPIFEVGEAAVDCYVRGAGWDPRAETGEWSMLFCSPTRMQVWNSVEEIRGRTIMADGQWRSDS